MDYKHFLTHASSSLLKKAYLISILRNQIYRVQQILIRKCACSRRKRK